MVLKTEIRDMIHIWKEEEEVQYYVKDMNELVDYEIVRPGFIWGVYAERGNFTIRELINIAGKISAYRLIRLFNS